MTDRRTPPRFLRTGLLAVAVAGALGGPAAADPMPSRDYPPTYTSKARAPWYDPFRLFTSSESKDDVPTPARPSRPIPNDTIDRGLGAPPAWKWYGYGTPTPGRNPLAPNGTYGPVPPGWHSTSGTTPGAIPTGQPVPGLVPDPAPSPTVPMGPASSIAIVPPDGPTLPAVVAPSTTTAGANVDWKSAPATLKSPVAPTLVNDGPRATLRAPVRDDAPMAPPATPPASTTPLERDLPTGGSKEVPVEAAPGIVAPPAGDVSRAEAPVTARGLAPAADLPSAAVRKACGRDVRVMEITSVGPKRMLVRLAATPDAAWAARDRLARLPELREWRVDFDLVTPLRP